ncbi:D-alanyl-D-alanine carboxypeptidase [Streptomyces palmae]|uniref:D-alanyl-D-alanine carboxypeptidase n=1 Tax=Streptomyces palmae TaxID=1701085 RepID=A0A4Z0HDU5_9ACTN|nr:D-alanyl-D-alanine carboxypeptidase [Streptomyces palmae]TGB11810.1 D-alanyl-D-alanine carboxypeptidase [Streptomyces palmae]
MAGESPDTSEQQKSSGEATPGERDPRLAVFREAEDSDSDREDWESAAEAGSSKSPESPADRATMTFRTRSAAKADAEESASDSKGARSKAEAESDAKGSAAGEGDTGKASGGDAGAGASDVRGGESADEDAEEASASGAVDDSGESDGATGSADAKDQDEEGSATGALPVRPGARASAAQRVEDAEGAREKGDSDRSGAGDEAEADDEAEGGDARLRAAVAAWVSGSGDKAADSAAEGAKDAKTAKTAKDARDAKATKDAVSGEAERDGAGEKTDRAAAEDAAEHDGAAEGSREDTRTMSFGTLRQKSGEQATDRATAFFGAVRSTEAPAGESQGADTDAEAAERRGVDRATAFFGAVRPRTTTETDGRSKDADAKDADAKDTGNAKDAKENKGAKGTGSGKPAGGAEGEGSAKDDAAGGRVDRATAVFGSVRLPEKPAGAGQDADGKAASDGKPATEGTSTASGRPAAEAAGKKAGPAAAKPSAKDAKPAADAEQEDAQQKGAWKDAVRRERERAGKDTKDAKDSRPAGKGAAAKPPVDQATTALKVPGAAPTTGEGGGAGKASTFVPLRSADAPAAKAGTAPDAGPTPLPESERTRQQPMPPNGQQPLDLLAQLTNTPPPPQTPVRSVMRRVKIWTPLVVLLLIVFCVAQVMRPLPDPELRLAEQTSFTFPGERFAMPWPGEGQAAVVVEGVGSVGVHGAQKPVPIASVTKVMTAYVVLKNHPLKPGETGGQITIDAQAGKESNAKDESRVPVEEGQKFNLRQMLEMTMIPSGNNVARQLARWDAGSETAFLKKMNDAAKALGMTNTVYTDPSGLKATTKSTAVDQLKLARAVMKDATFRQIVATPDIEIPGVGRIFNNNKLLSKPDLGVRGVKTGSNTPAGGALMWATYRTVGGKDRLVLGVTLDQHTNSTDPNAHLQLVLDKSEEQIRAIRGALTDALVVKKGQVVGYVDDGLGGSTPVVATRDLKGAGWPGLNVGFSLTASTKGVPHSAKAGTLVGWLTVGSGPGRARVPVALQKDLSEPSFGAKLTRIS